MIGRGSGGGGFGHIHLAIEDRQSLEAVHVLKEHFADDTRKPVARSPEVSKSRQGSWYMRHAATWRACCYTQPASAEQASALVLRQMVIAASRRYHHAHYSSWSLTRLTWVLGLGLTRIGPAC